MNLNKKIVLYIMLTILGILFFTSSIVLYFVNQTYVFLVLSLIGIITGSVLIGICSSLIVKNFLAKQSLVKHSFNRFIDEIISHNSIGAIIYDTDGKILWTSKFVKNRFGKNWIGNSLQKFFLSFGINFDTDLKSFNFKHKELSYNANIFATDNCISIRDNTLEQRALDIYKNESIVIGELEIDNFQLYQSILSEEQIYNVNKEVVLVLDSLVDKYNLVYRQYNTNGKYLIITNKESMEKMANKNFSMFAKLHKVLKNKDNNLIISVSIGFSYGPSELLEKMEQSKKALLQAQSRGGDQIAIFSKNEIPRYYGSTSEILPSVDRTRIKNITSIIEKKLSDSRINKAIIYGHANADLDAIGSAMGIKSLVETYKKEAYICSSTQDATTKKSIKKYFEDIEDIFIKPQQANKLSDESTLVFFVDNSSPERTDNPNAISKIKSNNIFILDHHRLGSSVDFANKENRIIDPSASSASEIVTQILMFSKKTIKIDRKTAQMLLNGIYLDTLQFQKHVTSKTFEVSSWLESKGANSAISNESLKIDDNTYQKVLQVLENIQEVKPGFFLAYKDIPLSNDVISIAAEEILRISGRKASFVVARSENSKTFKLSARGLNTNVQIIAESVGGGGHFGTAAATSNESLDIFIDNIKQAIVSVKNESNFN
ncbi:GGDEF domain-containing protein [Mycoplasmopsis lipofaciens]|uniref:DHH family phosphoesterase n=1 Tax=Mycoplasmopsis lipofaciens TaxID=114884 RepID=UPI0004823931|nr:DHH family phosphoesterase [Mycoplasmopsis lipofaciens]